MPSQDTQWYKLQYPDCFAGDEQRMVQQTLAEFVDREIMPMRHKIDDDVTHKEIIERILKRLQVDLGWRKSMIPKQYVGNEMMPLVTAALRQDQLSRAACGTSLASACVDWTLAPATRAYLFATSPTTKAWGKAALGESAPKFVEDRLRFGCFNMGEAQSACDIENHLNEARLIRTRATRSGNEWVIHGAKPWASNSGIAGLHCLACNMDPDSGVFGFTLICIPEPWPGVSHGKHEVKCGVNGGRNTSTYFAQARVLKKWGLPGPEARDIFLNHVVSAFAMNIANCTGMMQGASDVLLECTGQRVVGGKPIREHLPTVMFLGQMIGAISVARGAFLELGHQFDNPAVYGPWITDSRVPGAFLFFTDGANGERPDSPGYGVHGIPGVGAGRALREILPRHRSGQTGPGRRTAWFLFRLPGVLRTGFFILQPEQTEGSRSRRYANLKKFFHNQQSRNGRGKCQTRFAKLIISTSKLRINRAREPESWKPSGTEA